MQTISSDIFIPSRKRRQSRLTSEQTTLKKARHDGVLIIDECREEKKEEKTTRFDVVFESVPRIEQLEQQRDNIVVTSLMAINLYLDPATVMSVVLFWLSQHVNYSNTGSQWFNDHILDLMREPIRFNITSSQAIASIYAKLPKYTMLLKFGGSELHKVPSEYFVLKNNISLLESLHYLIQAKNQCFLLKNTEGLRGEMELGAFKYNNILSFFYEPSFFILTSYLVALHSLLSSTRGRATLNDFLPILKIMAQPLKNRNLEPGKLGCLCKENTNYETKLKCLQNDLVALREALEGETLEQVKDQVLRLWSLKATYANEQTSERYNSIYSQLYDRV